MAAPLPLAVSRPATPPVALTASPTSALSLTMSPPTSTATLLVAAPLSSTTVSPVVALLPAPALRPVSTAPPLVRAEVVHALGLGGSAAEDGDTVYVTDSAYNSPMDRSVRAAGPLHRPSRTGDEKAVATATAAVADMTTTTTATTTATTTTVTADAKRPRLVEICEGDLPMATPVAGCSTRPSERVCTAVARLRAQDAQWRRLALYDDAFFREAWRAFEAHGYVEMNQLRGRTAAEWWQLLRALTPRHARLVYELRMEVGVLEAQRFHVVVYAA